MKLVTMELTMMLVVMVMMLDIHHIDDISHMQNKKKVHSMHV